MRVLLDENLPHQLRPLITGHEVVTVAFLGWVGIRNGNLIAAAEQEGFEVLLSGDKNMAYQQNVTGRRLAIVTLSAMNWPIVRLAIPIIQAAIDQSIPGSFQKVECGAFRR